MSDLHDFLPLIVRTEADIRTQLNADANEGISIGDEERYVSTREIDFFHMNTQPFVQEMARKYDEASVMLATGFLPFCWGDYLDYWGELLEVERHPAVRAFGQVTFSGTNGTIIGIGTEVSTSSDDPDADPPRFLTTQSGTISGGTLVLNIEAVEAGITGNVAAAAIDTVLSNIAVTAVTNVTETTGGEEEETDDAFLVRLEAQFFGDGPGNISDYERWALDFTGVGRVTVVPVWNGVNTVMVVLMTTAGGAVAGSLVTAVQTFLDPVAGQAAGEAPVGATVTVVTPTIVSIPITAVMVLATGYTLDGTGGTIAVRSSIETALRDYVNNLKPGDDVVKNHVEAQFFMVEGVLDVTLSAPATDTVINGTSNPPQVARTSTITLT